jgi:Zn-dependent M28 family amino/carboxypeptidase
LDRIIMQKHADELKKARFMLNCDMPSPVAPHGLGFHECPKGEAYLKKLSVEMGEEIICQNRAHCHSDHYPFILQGVATAGVAGKHPENGPTIYIHSANDTAEKISIPDMNECAAFMARMMFRACNDEEWPDMRRTPEEIENFGRS